mgnify:CR=1 FL=1
MYFLVGDSGCGKTTLLNCISGLEDYSGYIEINKINQQNISEKEKDYFRLKNIGFVFQDFKLFEHTNVYSNIVFPLEIISNETDEFKNRKVKDLLNIVKLNGYENKIVNCLSGGEKQRISIARSLVNDPRVILADEPTGSLDNANSIVVMDILKNISKNRLIIVVSHDLELAKKYADEIIEIKDGEIIKVSKFSSIEEKKNLPLIKNQVYNKKPSIPFSFLLKHSIQSIKQRKWRTVFSNLVMSLGLIGVGLAVTLSETISTSIKKACSSFINEDRIIVSKKEQNYNYQFLESGSVEEASSIKNRYKEYINDYGVIYTNNFSNLFVDDNTFSIIYNSHKYPINYFSADEINEYRWIDDYEELKYYPLKPKILADDEIVISLNNSQIINICLTLQIFRTIDSLADYISSNGLYVTFNTRNDYWEYYDEHIFKIKAFVLDNVNAIYHTNHRWNQTIFEDEMRLPISYSLNTVDKFPWTLKKVTYFSLMDNKEEFIINFYKDESLDGFMLDIGNSKYFPSIYDYDFPPEEINKYIFYIDNRDSISPRYANYLLSSSEDVSSPILGSPGGYAIYSNALMCGFANYMYFSDDEELLDDTLEFFSTYKNEPNNQFEFPEHIKIGHYSRSMIDGVDFEPIDEDLTYDEIIISSKLNDELFNGKGLDNFLNLAYTKEEIHIGDSVAKTFSKKKLKIVKIIESDKYKIYHNQDWTYVFFLTKLGVSNFNLGINAISLKNSKDISSEKTIEKLEKRYSYFDFTNPLSEINKSVDNVCFYVEIALILFSIISITISIILLTMCNYLHVNEIRKDIGLSRCIGANKNESSKFVYVHSFLMCSISLALSFVELLFATLFISFMTKNILNVDMSFSFNPMSYLLMFLLAIFISIISSILISFRVRKFAPLEALRN